jgi:hypothetical protein
MGVGSGEWGVGGDEGVGGEKAIAYCLLPTPETYLHSLAMTISFDLMTA